MVEQVFLQLLNMSFTASVIILLVLLARVFLRKAPKIFSYALWSVVLFRLVCPFSFESVLSLLPTNTNPIPHDIMYAMVPQVNTGIPIVNNSINAALPAATPYASMNPMQGWIAIGSLLWLIGIAVLLLYSVAALAALKLRLRDAIHERDAIYTSQSLSSPFVMGIFRPKIYLPAKLSEQEKQYIILHEQTHIKRFDHVIKLVGYFALCLHWFNPLVWAAFMMSSRDMEMSCDESVIKALGSDIKQDYSSSLLNLAMGRRIVGGTPLAFGEGDTRCRIKNVLNYKKPAFWVVAVSVIAVAAVGIGLLTNPKTVKKATAAQEFLRYKTEFVGDAPKVGAIVGLLDFPAEFQYDSFALDTAAPPYGVTVYLRTDSATREHYSTDLSKQNAFRNNAYLLLSLIGNLDTVTFTAADKAEELSLHYSRASATGELGEDPRVFSESEQTFGSLLRMAVSESVHLLSSVAYDPASGTLSFTVSDKITAEMTPQLQISGRTEQDGNGMSLHLFESEPDGSWIPGKTYTAQVPAESLDFLTLYGTVSRKGGDAALLSEMTVQIDKDGNLEAEYKPEISGAYVVLDSAGTDITKEVTGLWADANYIYSVDDDRMFERGNTVQLFENAPEFNELKNYDEVVRRVFTTAGIAQLERTKIGGDVTLIQKRDGKTYRMASWKTGQYYTQAAAMQTTAVSENRITLRVRYAITLWDADLPTTTETTDFTIAKQNGRWLVEDYVYPEATTAAAPPAQEKAFFIPDMDAEQERFNREYVEPILLTGLLMRDWSTTDFTALLPDAAGQSDNALLYAFEDILGMETVMPILKQYSGSFPEKVIEDVLLTRFAFTAEQLHTILSPYYRADENMYAYEEMGRGGGPVECGVTGVTTRGDGSVVVDYLYMTSYYDQATTPEKDAYYDKTTGTLTLVPAPDGSYLYQSVAMGEHVSLEPAV